MFVMPSSCCRDLFAMVTKGVLSFTKCSYIFAGTGYGNIFTILPALAVCTEKGRFGVSSRLHWEARFGISSRLRWAIRLGSD